MADRQTVTVDAAALHQVLAALVGPGHHIRELQALMGTSFDPPNPIDILVREFNEQVAARAAAAIPTEGA